MLLFMYYSYLKTDVLNKYLFVEKSLTAFEKKRKLFSISIFSSSRTMITFDFPKQQIAFPSLIKSIKILLPFSFRKSTYYVHTGIFHAIT